MRFCLLHSRDYLGGVGPELALAIRTELDRRNGPRAGGRGDRDRLVRADRVWDLIYLMRSEQGASELSPIVGHIRAGLGVGNRTGDERKGAFLFDLARRPDKGS